MPHLAQSLKRLSIPKRVAITLLLCLSLEPVSVQTQTQHHRCPELSRDKLRTHISELISELILKARPPLVILLVNTCGKYSSYILCFKIVSRIKFGISYRIARYIKWR